MFDAAAVVPVVEPEITRAREAGLASSAIPCLVELQAVLLGGTADALRSLLGELGGGASRFRDVAAGALRRLRGVAEGGGNAPARSRGWLLRAHLKLLPMASFRRTAERRLLLHCNKNCFAAVPTSAAAAI